ncbi:MAG: Tol-Pal system protein TolR [Candidatus Celerinatantimonas neptuna]|nr:MAG: Tol-Pal system protein TolR [Candidatus Celerinatantimonas neptuna]
MKRRHLFQSQQPEEAQIDLTPMLDIVFIMLIFFIVSTSFVQESGIQINRPVANHAGKQTQNAQVIGISANGQIWLNRQPIVQQLLSGALAKLKTSNPKIAIVIQADKRVLTGRLIQVIDTIRQQQIPYSIATQNGKVN